MLIHLEQQQLDRSASVLVRSRRKVGPAAPGVAVAVEVAVVRELIGSIAGILRHVPNSARRGNLTRPILLDYGCLVRNRLRFERNQTFDCPRSPFADVGEAEAASSGETARRQTPAGPRS